MNVAYRRTWTQEDFLAWVAHQEESYDFEILVPSTARDGQTTKLHEYAAVPTILHHVIIATERVEILSYARTDGASPWQLTLLRSLHDELALPGIAQDLIVADIYAAIEISAAPPADIGTLLSQPPDTGNLLARKPRGTLP